MFLKLKVNTFSIIKIFICEYLYIMGKKIILTQRQLDEIVGGNAAYLDNVDSDFKKDGANMVYSGEKYDNKDCEPTTTDKISKSMKRNAGFYGLNRAGNLTMPVYIESKKSEWETINEINSNLADHTYGTKDNRVSNTNASTLKWRYGAAKKKAQSTDPTIRQQGISTMKTMEKNNPNLKQIEAQYDADMANDANLKKFAHDRGEENVYQEKGGTKVSNNGQAHTPKPVGQVITYDTNK